MQLKMHRIYQFFGFFLLCASICLAEPCKTLRPWVQAREECGKKLSENNECYWNCVHGILGVLDDSGRISEDKFRASVENLIENPELRQILWNSQKNCIAQVDDTMSACKASAIANKCSWNDKKAVQVIKDANFCVEDFQDLIEDQ